jgi:hypothetical protein
MLCSIVHEGYSLISVSNLRYAIQSIVRVSGECSTRVLRGFEITLGVVCIRGGASVWTYQLQDVAEAIVCIACCQRSRANYSQELVVSI